MQEKRSYADPRVPLVNDELAPHAVAIIPIRGGQPPRVNEHGQFEQGSGTCIVIGDRFFVATAAHVIDEYPETRYAVLSPNRTDGLRKVIGGGKRGGGRYDRLDVGWLELHAAAAKDLQRRFLPLERIRAHCDGEGEQIAFYGAAAQDQTTGRADDGLPVLTANGCWWAARALFDRKDLGYEPERDHRIYLDWPTEIIGHDGEPYSLPEAPGMSGGGIWALNIDRRSGEEWRPRHAQLVGIETGWLRNDVPRRHLRGYQMHTWLRMLREDVPELGALIDPFLAAVTFR